MFLQSDIFKCLQLDSKLKTHCNLDYTNKLESICKRFDNIYIKFQQINIYTSIIDLEFSINLANLFIGLLVQKFLVFSSPRSSTSNNMSSFWLLKIVLHEISIDSFSKPFQFLQKVPYIHCGLLSSPYFCIQICSGLYYLSLHNTRGRFFQFVFSDHSDQFQQVTYGHLFVVQ